jgi:predicted MFS family arabinose efflux permease
VTQEAVDPKWRSTASGVSNLASGVGVSGMSAVGGYMASGLGYRTTCMTGAAPEVLGALVFWLCFRVPRGQRAGDTPTT